MKTRVGKLTHMGSAFFWGLLGLLFVSCAEIDQTANSELGSCQLCHKQALNDFQVHKTHVSISRMQRSSLIFNEALSPDVDSLMDVPDSLMPASFRCDLCHQGYGENGNSVNENLHQNGKLDVVFNKKLIEEFFSDLAEIKEHNPHYDGESCSSVSCHGPSRAGKEDVTWKQTFRPHEELNCNGCHDISKHKVVDSKQQDCGSCHLTAQDTTAITHYSLHFNGIYGEPKETLQSCENCHAPINHSNIHRAHISQEEMKLSSLPFDQELADSLNEGQPLEGLADSLVPKSYRCDVCHDGYGKHGKTLVAELHRNGKSDIPFNPKLIEATFEDTAEITLMNPQTFKTPDGVLGCSNIACHSPGRSGVENIIWRDTVLVNEKLDCNGCHDNTKHKVSGGNQKRCGVCHESAYDKTSIQDYRLHINGVVEED